MPDRCILATDQFQHKSQVNVLRLGQHNVTHGVTISITFFRKMNSE